MIDSVKERKRMIEEIVRTGRKKDIDRIVPVIAG